MKPVRRIAIIVVSVVILLGVGVAFLIAHPASSPEKTREPLGNFDAETQSRIANAKHVVFLIPFSHWDTDWHQSFDTYSKMADQNILRAIELAKQDSRFRFTFEQVLFVQHFWDAHPASRADLVSLVRNRQLTFAWGGITQPDTSLVAPAIQVRNLQLGQAWIEQNFGSAYLPQTAWQSDAFGNSAAFPTFLTQLHIPYLFIGRHQGRCDPDYQQCQPLPPLFYWTSPASSAGRVLVAYMSYQTAWGDMYLRTDPDAQIAELRKTIDSEFKQTDSKYIFLPVGFDFFDPRASLMTFVDKWNTADKDTLLVVADPESAFQYLGTQSLPEISSDMNPIWQAFYNTRPAAKIADKESEYYLTAADKFGLLLDAPTSSAWNLAAINAHYDNISGVSYDSVWNNSQRPRYEQTISTAKEDLANILARIAGQVSAPVVIFNPSSWSRSEVIEINSDTPDINSLPQPVQHIGSDKIAFRVENIPALGYAGSNSNQSTTLHSASVTQNGNLVTLSNGLVSVIIDGDHGGTFSSLMLFNKSSSQELLKSFGDDVVYWDDSGDVYGAFFGNERARESKVSAALTILADGPLIARVQAVFMLGGQQVVKTVTLKADDPLVEVVLDISALPETTAIAETSTNIDTDIRTDDLGFGAFEHKIDANPITPGDRTYRRSIFYPVMYWSDASSNNIGLTLITHGLQGVSGGATRGVMLVRQVTKDPEGLTDPGVHHLSYGYLPHVGTADSAQPWIAAYEFNQPLIVVWKNGGNMNIQLPFDHGVSPRQFNEEAASSTTLPNTFSLLSAQNAMVTDLYRQDNQIKALILNYSPSRSAALQVGGQSITLPQIVFTLMPLFPSALEFPVQK